tara:strand:- start:670 stop:873 length:204 start_codon:yes stop_codon:yes gene_type:complete
MEYIIVKANSIMQLQERVQELITEQGWKPIGGAFSIAVEPEIITKWRHDHRPKQHEFVQSMTREGQE